MACCGNRRRRPILSSVPLPDPTPSNGTLSAARLSPNGWVQTCTVCGKVSEPSSFPDTITSPCSCTKEQNG